MSNLKKLLGQGLFPAQMPPCFTSLSLASAAISLRKDLLRKGAAPRGHPYNAGPRLEHFSVARSSHSRRPISIPNPVSHFFLSELVAKHWRQINKYLKTSPLSLSTPIFEKNSSRAISITPHSKLHEYRLKHLISAQYILVTDISQFFPSLYTHSISWALHSKETAKKHKFDSKLLGNKLDKAVQATQNGQTLGIPIGPDTSHIISEIIGTALDKDFLKRKGSMVDGYRHVDDYFLLFSSLSEAEKALSALEASVRSFELKLNPLKTKIIEISSFSDDIWPHELLDFSFSDNVSQQRRQISHFFEKTFQLARVEKDENIVRFGLRHISTKIIKRQNWDVFQLLLQRCAIAYPGALQDIALILFTYDRISYPIHKALLTKTLQFILIKHIPLGHHSEAAWALWLCLYFRLKINLERCKDVIYESGSTVLLLAQELSENNLFEPRIDRRKFRTLANAAKLYDEDWLMAYEFGRKNLVPGGKDFIKNDHYFSVLFARNIEFFDPGRLPEPLFTPNKELDSNVYESDEDISDDFEFLPVSDTYLSASRVVDDDPLFDADRYGEYLEEQMDVEDDIPF